MNGLNCHACLHYQTRARHRSYCADCLQNGQRAVRLCPVVSRIFRTFSLTVVLSCVMRLNKGLLCPFSFMKVKTAMRASALVRNFRRSRSSHSSVAKKLSHIALSYASPSDSIDGRTLASLHLRPKATEVYCDPWSSDGSRSKTLYTFSTRSDTLPGNTRFLKIGAGRDLAAGGRECH
jgi:hypothetical protein